MNADTPRTNAELRQIAGGLPFWTHGMRDLLFQIESELNAANAKLAAAEKICALAGQMLPGFHYLLNVAKDKLPQKNYNGWREWEDEMKDAQEEFNATTSEKRANMTISDVFHLVD